MNLKSVKKNRKEILTIVLVFAVASIIAFKPQLEEKSRDEVKKLDECRDKDRFEKQFCISSVAEMKEDATVCSQIGEKYSNIQDFCEARIKLNETKCKTLNDQKLRDSCLESIEMKKEWGKTG